MNGIGGVWRFDGDPTARDRDAELLAAALRRRGPDGGATWRSDGVALVCRTFPVDALARREEQPAVGEGGAVLLWDGRLDDRQALAARLPEAPADATDPQLVLAAHRRWGTDFPRRLLGDFALALWDGDARRLLLVRDPGGLRPLFYRREGKRFLWASTLGALRAAGAPARPDAEWIAGYFAFELEVERTPFAGVRAVPPGHSVVVDAERQRTARHRRLEPRAVLRYRDDREYEEHFREVFARAVGDRLRTDRPAGAELSGGLDSSSVACQAAALIAAGRCPAPRLVTLSYVFDESRTADERGFIERVERALGRKGLHVVQEEHPPFRDLDDPFFEIPSPLHCTRGRVAAGVRRLRDAGCRLLLSGLGGDEALWSEVDPGLEVADAVAAGRWTEVPARLRGASSRSGEPYPSLLWQGLVLPFLPAPLRRRWGPAVGASPPWLDRRFVRRAGLEQCFLGASRGLRFPVPSQRVHYEMMVNVLRLSAWRGDPGPVALELAQPFLDLRLLELCLALPLDQLLRGGVSRSLLRRALADLLPPAILARRGKRSLDEALLRGVAQSWPQLQPLLDGPRVVERGFADGARLRRALEQARFGRCRDTVALLQVVGLEFWLRGLEEGGAAPSHASMVGCQGTRP